MESYYLWLNEARAGPYTSSQIRSMWSHGLITTQTLYWLEGMEDWKPLGEIATEIERKEAKVGKSKRNPKPFLIGSLLLLIALGSAIAFLNKIAVRHEKAPATGRLVGEVFIVKQDGHNVKLGLVDIGFFLLDTIQSILDNKKDFADAECVTLLPKIKAAEKEQAETKDAYDSALRQSGYISRSYPKTSLMSKRAQAM